MTDKELRKLRRDDLLQILINQQRQIDELNGELARAKEALEDRRIAIEQSGSLAEAALKLNGVFESAQAAADQYLQQAQADADALRAQAQAEADKARVVAEDVLQSARGEAERILRQAREEGERAKGASIEPAAQSAPQSAPQPDEGKRRGLFGRNRKA